MDNNIENMNNEELIKLWNETKDDNLIYIIIEKNIPLINKLCIKYNFCNIDKEDILQEAKIITYKCICYYNNDIKVKFSTYLVTALSRGLLRFSNKEKNKWNSDKLYYIEDLLISEETGKSGFLEMWDDGKDMEESIINSQIVDKVLGEVSERNRSIFILYFYKNMSTIQIASIMGLSQPQISKIVRKIVHSIREYFI